MNTTISGSKAAAVVLIATALLLGGSPAHAEDGWHRKGTWETYGSAQYLFGDTVDFSKFGARLKVDDTALFGLGVGYHVTDHWAVSLDLLGGFNSFNSSSTQLALNNDAFAQPGIITTGFVEVRGSFFASRLLQRGFKDFVLGSVAAAHGLTPCLPDRARSANTAFEAA